MMIPLPLLQAAPSAGWDAYLVICPIIGLLALFTVVLMQMIAKTFGLQSLSMWVKAEYAQVAVTFMIIAGALAMQTAGAAVVSEVTATVAAASGNIPLNQISQNSLGDPVLIAKSYLDSVAECERNIYLFVFALDAYLEPLSKTSLDVLGVEVMGGGLAFSGWVSLFHYIMNNIIYLVLFHYIQYNVLTFSQYTMLNIFLPIGLILRSFQVTRGAGGLVTAFALGFAFVFPFSYVLIIAMMPNVNVMCNDVKVSVQNTEFVDPCYNSQGSLVSGYYSLKSKTAQMSGVLDAIEHSLNILFLQAMFYPLVALTITFTFIRQTGSLFGADLAEIGRGLIKII